MMIALLLAGMKDKVEAFKAGVRKQFNITDLGPIKKHLGVWCEHVKEAEVEYFRMTME